MDRTRFEKITATLMERVHKNSKTRKVYKQRANRGEEVPESNEDSLTWIPKAKAYPCEDCDCIVVNPTWHIMRRFDANGCLRWWKYCKQCQKYFIFKRKTQRRAK